MTTTTRVNLREEEYDVYVGRAFRAHGHDLPDSGWGNPFVVGRDGTRAEVVERYEQYILTRPDLLARLPELEGKRLGCWCRAGEPCHADVLVRLVERRSRRAFPLEDANRAAHAVAAALRGVASDILVAGSIRRRKPVVKDIEIVARPITRPGQVDLFGTPLTERNLLDEYVDQEIDRGAWGHRLDVNGRAAAGARYKRLLVHRGPAPGIGLDLFSVMDPAQWGVIAVIRTGPAGFSQRLVTPRSSGGLLPDRYRVRDGAIWEVTSAGAPVRVIETPDERAVFDLLGLRWMEPEERE